MLGACCPEYERGHQDVSTEMLQLLRELRKKVVIGVVGGSDFVKISEQLSVGGANGAPLVPQHTLAY